MWYDVRHQDIFVERKGRGRGGGEKREQFFGVMLAVGTVGSLTFHPFSETENPLTTYGSKYLYKKPRIQVKGGGTQRTDWRVATLNQSCVVSESWSFSNAIFSGEASSTLVPD